MDDRAAATISFTGGSGIVSYTRFDEHSTLRSCSSIILDSCSSDDECHTPPLQKKNCRRIRECFPNGDRTLSTFNIDRNFTTSGRDNVAASFDDERHTLPPRRLPPIPEDKLHRRNPHMVRQEIQMFDNFAPEATLDDVQLSEMPGLQNKEQWKRIAGRTGQTSPPLSRQYYQTVVPTLGQDDNHIPQALGPYRQPGRSPPEPDTATGNRSSPCLPPRRRVVVGSSVVVVIVAVVIAVVVAVTLARAPIRTITDYYSGNIFVQARFLPSLINPTSTLAKNYKREFCSLVGTTLADTKTKYAVFYSTCTVTGFRNGSIIASFVLGFTRYQNVTRLNAFLNRTLVGTQLFGGAIQAIIFNLTVITSDNSSDNSSYDDNGDDDYDISSYDTDLDTNQNRTKMNDQNTTSPTTNDHDRKALTSVGPEQQSRTTYTTVTYTTLDKGLSITISETITITNKNPLNALSATSPTNNNNNELLLIPTVESPKSIVVRASSNDAREKTTMPPPPPPPPPLPPAAVPASPTVNKYSPSYPSYEYNRMRPINKTSCDPTLAYIDESSDDRTISSKDGSV